MQLGSGPAANKPVMTAEGPSSDCSPLSRLYLPHQVGPELLREGSNETCLS